MIAAVKEWAYALFLTAAAGGIASFLAPDNPKMKKYVKLATAVCAAAILLAPLKNVTGSFSFDSVQTVQYNYSASLAYAKVEEIICDEINDRVYANFGFYADSVAFDGDTLVLTVTEQFDYGALFDFVSSLYFGNVEILP